MASPTKEIPKAPHSITGSSNSTGADKSKTSGRPHVVIVVGAGFGGLAAAKALRKTPAKVILIDRTNHHLFQPLLYQAATSVLTVNPDCDPNTQHFAQPKEHHGALGGSHWSGQS